MRRTKTSLIYRRTKNTRAVQILLGHTELESTESPMVSWTYPTDCLWPVSAPRDSRNRPKAVSRAKPKRGHFKGVDATLEGLVGSGVASALLRLKCFTKFRPQTAATLIVHVVSVHDGCRLCQSRQRFWQAMNI